MNLLDDLNGNLKEEKPLAQKQDELQGIISGMEVEYLKYQEEFRAELDKIPNFTRNNTFSLLYEQSRNKIIDCPITPQAINYFLKEHKSEGTANYEDVGIELFASILFQSSYNQGHNDFNVPLFRLKDGSLIWSCYKGLVGTVENKINLIIDEGGAQSSFGYLDHVNIKFSRGVGKHCVDQCHNSKIVFGEDVGGYNFQMARNCEVYIHGNIGDHCGYSSKNTRFFSPHMNVIEQISKENYIEDCSFFLIEEDGVHTEVTFK